jgi:hypothetical protein
MKVTSYVVGARTAVLVVALAACGDDADRVSVDAMQVPDAIVDAPACTAGTHGWTINFREDSPLGPGLANVHTCVLTHPQIPCTDTGVDGNASICVPDNSEIAISAEKADHMPIIHSFVTSISQPMDLRARFISLNVPSCAVWSSGGVSCPPSATDAGGMLWIGARVNDATNQNGPTTPYGYPDPLGDVVVELMPAAQIEPFYLVNGLKDPNLTATHPSAGNALAGDVTEGDQQIVKLTRAGSTCHAFSYNAWPGPTAETIRVPIRRGFRSFAAVTCD